MIQELPTGQPRPGSLPAAILAPFLAATDSKVLVNCGRQVGKSTAVAGLALATALTEPRSLVLIVAPSQRQSSETYRKVQSMLSDLDYPVPVLRETLLAMELLNHSRILALPGANESNLRGFSAPRLIVFDEAARTTSDLFHACMPMLAATNKGAIVALSTPAGRRGWWSTEWHEGQGWQRIEVKAVDVARIDKTWLESIKKTMGPRWYRQEFECSFEAAADAVFDPEIVRAALRYDMQPVQL